VQLNVVICGINIVVISDKSYCFHYCVCCLFVCEHVGLLQCIHMSVGTEKTKLHFSQHGTLSRPAIYLCLINGEIHIMGEKVTENKSSSE